MKEKLKTIFQTLMFVFIVAFIGLIYYSYQNTMAKEQVKFDNEVAETLEEIIFHLAHYAGWPNAVSSSNVLAEVWQEMDEEKD